MIEVKLKKCLKRITNKLEKIILIIVILIPYKICNAIPPERTVNTTSLYEIVKMFRIPTSLIIGLVVLIILVKKKKENKLKKGIILSSIIIVIGIVVMVGVEHLTFYKIDFEFLFAIIWYTSRMYIYIFSASFIPVSLTIGLKILLKKSKAEGKRKVMQAILISIILIAIGIVLIACAINLDDLLIYLV